MKPQCCLILLNLAWLKYNEFHGVLSITEYPSNVAEISLGRHRRLRETYRMVLSHSGLDRHVHQTRHAATSK